MPQFKTLQFPNTAEGQAAKVRALEREAADGWRVVSETIVAGKFRGGKACCFFLILAPCAFLAGHEPDMITVTLERADRVPHKQPSDAAPPPAYDRVKWGALRQYDAEIAAAADELAALGPKWEEELAAAYMAISDKTYLVPIVTKLKERAASEKDARRQEEERNSAAAALRASQPNSSFGQARSSDGDDSEGDGTPKLLMIVVFIAIGVLVIWALASASNMSGSPSPAESAPPAATAQVAPSFDCTNVTAQTLKLICTTPELGEADLRLARAYSEAMARTILKVKLRREQRAWIAERNNGAAEISRLRQLYNERTYVLERFN